jgi:predicted nucleic acid-binding protein
MASAVTFRARPETTVAEDPRHIAFDSNVLTYFLDGNRGNYSLATDDSIADQRVAAVRLFLYCTPFIVPTVRQEASSIPDAVKLEEHIRFIDGSFGELIPDEDQEASIARRAAELLPYHPKGPADCRIVAEVEQDRDIPVVVTFDDRLRRDLGPHARIRIESPVECWEKFAFPRGTPPKWTPASGHPLANERWWRWD